MTPQEQEALVMELQSERMKRMSAENNSASMSGYNPNKEPNIIEYQLDVSPLLDRLFHLLSGHIVVRDSNGAERWEEPNDDRLKILSDYGVKQIMNLLAFYITPNNLLSNYDEDQINWKVKDFGNELADLMFNRYEMFFYHKSPEDLFELYKPIVQEKKLDITETELYFKCVQWSREELQSKFRHYPMMILQLIDTVHATYLRALNGEERTSLRKQYNIHQSLTGEHSLNPTAPTKSTFQRLING